jgi:hypothetical protein
MASIYSANLVPNHSLSLFPLPRPTGRVLDYETSPDTITVVRTSDFNHYIEPPSEPGAIRKDLVMTGFVVVHTSKPCRARRLRVRFVAEATLAFPGASSWGPTTSTTTTTTTYSDGLSPDPLQAVGGKTT